MQIILDHFYQHLAGYINLVVSLPPVFIEIPQPRTLELANLAVPGLYLVVDITDVAPHCFDVKELQFAMGAWLCLLPLGMVPPDVFQEIFVGC